MEKKQQLNRGGRESENRRRTRNDKTGFYSREKERSLIAHIKQASFSLLCNSELPTLILLDPCRTYASTSHSYHTLRSSVCLHMLTSTTPPSGRNIGNFNGKKIGNQLIIPALFSSIVRGFVDNSTPGYRTVSK